MGVKHLWSIIQPVGKKEPLESLRGKTVCVDLSTWICQADETLPLKHAVLKPYLRNTIFRVLCLKRLGTRLIFLTEGEPPELKWNVILARASARADTVKGAGNYSCSRKTEKGKAYQCKTGSNANAEPATAKPKRVGRSVFQRKINECTQLLKYLGIPVIKSKGEAEACCALLDRKKLADGCITQDGDTFLYGANVVYRNLGISNKDPHVYRYSMDDVQKHLGIDRQQMIALSLLFGCDYCDGVQGIGVKSALKLLSEQRGVDVLQTFRDWAKDKKLPDTSSSIEKQIFRKLMQVDGFPNEEVIKEFLQPKDDFEAIKRQISWDYPDLVNIQRFCFKHMEWPEEYTLSKVLGVAANEHLNRISRGIPVSCPFTPHRLVKPRTLHGVPLCEIEWRMEPNQKIPGLWESYPETFITLESQQEVLQCLPELVKEFEQLKSQKRSRGKKNRKKASEERNDVEDKNDDVPVSQTESNASNYQKQNADTLPKALESFDKNHDKKFEWNVEDPLSTNIKENSTRRINGFATADSHFQTAEDPCSIDDIVQSFIEIDLSSFCAEDTDLLAGENSNCPIGIDQEDIVSSHLANEASQMLPLRERLGRKAMNSRNELHTREESITKNASKMPLEITSLRNKGHSTRENTECSNDIVISSLKKREECLEEPSKLNNTSNKRFECTYGDERLVSTAIEEIEHVNSRLDEQDIVQNSESEPLLSLDGTTTQSPKRVRPLMTKENDSIKIEQIDISNDTIAHIMMQSFDTPQASEERDNLAEHKSSPSNDEYMNCLRERVGISKQLTPKACHPSNEDLFESTVRDEKSSKVPLPLMERLKRRLQKM